MSTNCFHFSNHICGFRGSKTRQGTSKQRSAKHPSLHLQNHLENCFTLMNDEHVQLQLQLLHIKHKTPPDKRDNFWEVRQWVGSHLVSASANVSQPLTPDPPPKCDGPVLTNQTEIWPNFPLYICQIYCQSLD